MLEAIFYARFHQARGVSVVHQYPVGSILSTSPEKKPLITWSDISSYIIPPYDLCNDPLSICSNGYRVLAFPISLEDSKYNRNRFTFNICFVLDEDEDAQPWDRIVRKTAKFLTSLEEEEGLLQKEEDLPGLKWAGEERYPADVGIVYTMLENIFEDLNAYGEACVRVDDANVLNLRLDYEEPAAPQIHAWDVPLLVRSLPSPADWTWDLTLQRIHPHIDGIKHVQRIAELADVELKLVKRAVKELVYYGRAMLLDIFHFQAIYTCNDEAASFAKDEELLDECRHYVAITPEKKATNKSDLKDPALPSQETIIELYALLQPGLQLYEYCITHKTLLASIDVRRFITFGIIKGFIRRVHKYALAIESHPTAPLGSTKKHSSGSISRPPRSNEDAVREFDRAWRKAALSSGWATPPSAPANGSLMAKSFKSADRLRNEEDERLRWFLDGTHCFDEICVAMHLSEKKVVERLRSKAFREVVLFNK